MVIRGIPGVTMATLEEVRQEHCIDVLEPGQKGRKIILYKNNNIWFTLMESHKRFGTDSRQPRCFGLSDGDKTTIGSLTADLAADTRGRKTQFSWLLLKDWRLTNANSHAGADCLYQHSYSANMQKAVIMQKINVIDDRTTLGFWAGHRNSRRRVIMARTWIPRIHSRCSYVETSSTFKPCHFDLLLHRWRPEIPGLRVHATWWLDDVDGGGGDECAYGTVHLERRSTTEGGDSEIGSVILGSSGWNGSHGGGGVTGLFPQVGKQAQQ
ncbi:hypothetical protein Tco_0455984 [Tanacetum coccineum]